MGTEAWRPDQLATVSLLVEKQRTRKQVCALKPIGYGADQGTQTKAVIKLLPVLTKLAGVTCNQRYNLPKIEWSDCQRTQSLIVVENLWSSRKAALNCKG